LDRESRARTLERAEQLVIEGDRLIAQQKDLIDRLLTAGLDASGFHNRLAELEQSQSLRIQSAARLKKDLLNASPSSG
jgi:hypothetical protein